MVTTDNSGEIPGISPKQSAFLVLDQHEALYGGSAGGGKSESLLQGATQDVDDWPVSSLLLRRTYRDLDKPGGLMFRAREWFTGTKAHWDGINYRWIFPSGATINFGYLDHEGDELKFQSSEYQYCVRSDTLILMGNGTWKPIHDIKIGEYVDTLIGSKRVNKVHRVGVKPVVRITTEFGSTVVSSTHPLLTDRGWVSPEALRSTQSRGDDSTDESCSPSPQASGWPHEPRPSDRQRRPGPVRRMLDRMARLVASVSPTGGRTGSSTSGGECRESLLLPQWYAQPMLHEPAVRSAISRSFRLGEYGDVDASYGYGVQDSPSDCQPYPRSHDARLRQFSTADQAHIPSPAGAVATTPVSTLTDDPTNTPSHIRQDLYEYFHPYTNQPVVARVGVLQASALLAPAGEAEVWDLEVDGASHYVAYPGIIAMNCGFDELTHFPEHQYLYLFSRLRRLKGSPIPLRMRAGSNPGGPGHEWVRKRWSLPGGPPPGSDRVFVSATIDDNPFLQQEEYKKGLAQLGDVTRAQLLEGDWSATSTGGYFQAGDFRLCGWDEVPPGEEFAAVIRYWDFAATEPSELNPDPDYTVGLKIGITKTGSVDPTMPDWYVLDVNRFRGNPGMVENQIRATAQRDGSRVVQWLEQERGSAGKHLSRHYDVNVLPDYTVRSLYATGTKEARAMIAAARVNEGRVFLVDGEWIDDFVAECAVFPLGSHDDQVDTLSNGLISLERERHMASTGGVYRRGKELRPVRRVKDRAESIGRHVGY